MTSVKTEVELAAEYDRMMANDRTAIFVFGSNLAGIHGGGAALSARMMYGALFGQGGGLQGRSYAIATKDEDLATRSLDEIAADVIDFLDFARANPGQRFLVTRIGCGRAGYMDAEIAPMFRGAPANVSLPDGWSDEKPVVDYVNGCDFCGHLGCQGCCHKCNDPNCYMNSPCPGCGRADSTAQPPVAPTPKRQPIHVHLRQAI